MKNGILLSAIIAIASSTLSLINTSCVCQKVPQFVQAQSLITEADQALQQAKSLMDIASGVPANVREEFDKQYEKAHSGLQNAARGLSEATQSCSINTIPTIFQDFNAAWAIIRNLLPIIASYSKAGQTKVGAAPVSTPLIKDPICFSIK